MTKDEALKLALEALEIEEAQTHYPSQWLLKAITAIKEALAQPEQEPVGLIESLKDAQPCCGEYQTCWRACTPRGKFLAQRTWVGLTLEELSEIYNQTGWDTVDSWGYERAIEAKLKEKNFG